MDSHLWKPWRLHKPAPTSGWKYGWKSTRCISVVPNHGYKSRWKMNNSVAALAIPEFQSWFEAVRPFHFVWFMLCYFPENDQCNWEADQGPEHQRYVFPRGLGLLGRNSCPCLSVWHVWSRSQHNASNLCLFAPEHVLMGESSWVCIIINN